MVEIDATGKATFRFIHGGADPAYLVGDFCHWQTDHLPMRRVSPHEWMLMLRLPPGTYEFRYFAGGQWYTDFAAFGVTRGRFGGQNAVLRVPKIHAPAEPPVRVRQVRVDALGRSSWRAAAG